MLRSIGRGLVLLGVLAPLAAADVLIVDASGGGDHLQISGAVAVASPGDTLLVRSGAYGSFSVDGKPLTIVADSAASVTMAPMASVSLRNLTAGATVVVRGVDFSHADVAVRDNPGGHVRFERCGFLGQPGTTAGWPVFGVPGTPGVEVEASTSVAFVSCDLEGGEGHDWEMIFDDAASAGGPAMRVDDSLVVVDHCSLVGGRGGYGFDGSWSDNGGHGLDVSLGSLLVAGSSVVGGSAMGSVFCTSRSGDGLHVEGPGSTVRVLESSFESGASALGCEGRDIDAPPGVVIEHPAQARGLTLPAPLRERQTAVLIAQGQPGDLVLLYLSSSAGFLPMPGKQGTLLLEPPLLGPLALGTIVDPGGELAVVLDVGALPGAVAALTLHLQAVFVNVEETVLGPSTWPILLDASY
jgi:hypothetical protein